MNLFLASTVGAVLVLVVSLLLVSNQLCLLLSAESYPIGTDINLCATSPESLQRDFATILPLPSFATIRHLRSSEMSSYPFTHGQKQCVVKFPVVIEPSTDEDDIYALKTFLSQHNYALHAIQRFGAILFRGWSMSSGDTDTVQLASDFLDDILQLNVSTTRGYINSRPHIENTHFIRVAPYPAQFILMPHIELSNRRVRPQILAFYVNETAEKHGETPLIDFGNVWDALPADLQRKMEEKHVLFVNHLPSKSASTDIKFRSSWQESFATNDSQTALQRCNELNDDVCRFMDENALRFDARMPAAVTHPVWNRKVLSTSLNSWHAHFQILTHCKVFGDRFTVWEKLKMYAYFRWQYHRNNKIKTMLGDQSMLSLDEIDAVVHALWQNAVIYKPQKNDIVVIDNIGIGHARLNIAGDVKKRSQLAYIAGQYSAIL